MAIIIGHAGESARKTWFVDQFALPVIGFIAAVLVTPLFAFAFSRGNPVCIVVEVVLVSAVCLYVWRADYREMFVAWRNAHKWAQGADGEARTGQALASLSDSYIVFHDFNPVNSGVTAQWNVDHVVIGPNGMFVIETKNYSRARVLPAAKSSYTAKNVKQVRGNSLLFKNKIRAWSAGDLGDVFVVPLLVYTQDGAFVENTREGDVQVIPVKWLATQITDRNARRQLNPDECYRIASVLFQQMEPYQMDAYRSQIDRYGVESRQFKLDRASARRSSSSPQSPTTQPAHSEAPAETSVGVATLDLPGSCPRCGGGLVERTARTGARAGKRFLGCANFRATGCKYLINLEE